MGHIRALQIQRNPVIEGLMVFHMPPKQPVIVKLCRRSNQIQSFSAMGLQILIRKAVKAEIIGRNGIKNHRFAGILGNDDAIIGGFVGNQDHVNSPFMDCYYL